jgi:hypothetical protein
MEPNMGKKYSSEFWDLDALLDATQYAELTKCIGLIEHQIESFDDRNDTEYSANFATLVQTSFLMTAIALLEHHLKKICDVVAELRNFEIRTTDMKGANGFESCIAYLRKVLKVPLSDGDLKVIRAVVQVRNACVHQGGYLDVIPAELGKAASHLGKLADGQLEISGPFVQDVCELCRAFVDSVVAAVRAQYSSWEKSKKGRSSK